jgi:mutator protein MutT
MNFSKIPSTYVGAIIVNKKGNYLLQKRDCLAPTYKHRWTLFGGKVKKDESPNNAILRELKEEISLKKNNILSIKKVQINYQKNNSKQIIFYIITDAKLPDLELSEGEKMQYIPPNNLFKRKFAFNIKEVLNKFLNSQSNL